MLKKSRIAIIEDETAIAQMYKFRLEQEGYQIEIAYDGKSGLQLCEEFKPDLVLLDIKMPNMDGTEMLEKLRTYSWGSEMKVIVLTNISRDEAPAKLRFLDVERYIVKAHYTPAQVSQVVHEVLDYRPPKP